MKLYDEKSSDWQQGYDDFYGWFDDAYEVVEQYPNEPNARVFDSEAQLEKAAREYHAGWDHANYESAYEGYKLAKEG